MRLFTMLCFVAMLIFAGCKNDKVRNDDEKPIKTSTTKDDKTNGSSDPLKVDANPFQEEKVVSPEDQLAHDQNFEEGERYKRQALTAFEVGNEEEAREVAKKAIESFTSAHTFDTTGITACSIGYVHYLLGNYHKSIEWFETSINIDALLQDNDFAFMYWGMAEVNLGKFESSLDAFYQSVTVNQDPAHKAEVVKEIEKFGNYSWNLGVKYQDNVKQSNSYKRFGLGTWVVAYSVDTMNVEVTKKIIGGAKELEIPDLVARYEAKLGRISKE